MSISRSLVTATVAAAAIAGFAPAMAGPSPCAAQRRRPRFTWSITPSTTSRPGAVTSSGGPPSTRRVPWSGTNRRPHITRRRSCATSRPRWSTRRRRITGSSGPAWA